MQSSMPKMPCLQIQRYLSVWQSAGLFLALLCFIGALSSPAADAPGDYLTDVWTSENGMPDSSVTAIAQTPDGYLWIGTYNGLSRFDGEHFVTFDPANTPALCHARVRKLYVDSRGTLWIVTYDGSLTVFRDGNFQLERRVTRASDADLSLISTNSGRVSFSTIRGGFLSKPVA